MARPHPQHQGRRSQTLDGRDVRLAAAPGAILAGKIERMHRSALILTFGGSTNEAQRDIIVSWPARAGVRRGEPARTVP